MEKRDKPKYDVSVDKLLYKTAINEDDHLRKGYEALKTKAGTLIGFTGVILNLEILATVQLTSKSILTPYILFLVCSSIILFISLLFAMKAFKGSIGKGIDVDKLIDQFYDKKEEEVLQNLYATIGANITNNKKQLFKGNDNLNLASLFLMVGIFFVLLFFFCYTVTILS